MAITVSQMAANEATVTISGGALGDEGVTVIYYPNKISTSALTKMDEGLDGTITALLSVIKSWDFLEDDASMWPVTQENLTNLGVAILRQIRQGILEDIRPN